MNGILITFEGGEGCGKSTQAKLLSSWLKTLGYTTMLTREPGGTELAEKLRELVVKGTQQLGIYTEMLIFMAARSDHWQQCIEPALNQGHIVICDRFHDSTLVYQCMCGGCNTQLVNNLYLKITNGFYPDCTFILDIDPSVGLLRSITRHGNTDLRFESKSHAFHKKVRKHYQMLASTSSRYHLLDSSQLIEQLHQKIQAEVNQLLDRKNFHSKKASV